jgi:hypothetical protein
VQEELAVGRVGSWRAALDAQCPKQFGAAVQPRVRNEPDAAVQSQRVHRFRGGGPGSEKRLSDCRGAVAVILVAVGRPRSHRCEHSSHRFARERAAGQVATGNAAQSVVP